VRPNPVRSFFVARCWFEATCGGTFCWWSVPRFGVGGLCITQVLDVASHLKAGHCSVYVGEKVSDFTQPMRSAAGNVDQFLASSSRVRCSLARHLFTLSLGVWLKATVPAARQLAVRSQLGTLSATAARVRRAEASVRQNEMPSALPI
jgi:hypothetical protein